MDDSRVLIQTRLDDLERDGAWLARKIGVHRSLVFRWLSGERTIPERRRREIGLVLGKGADWLPHPAGEPGEVVAA